jgi:hypothetical protein
MRRQQLNQRVTLTTNQDQLDAIDNWRRKPASLPNRNQAIRRLINRGLEAEGETPPASSDEAEQ